MTTKPELEAELEALKQENDSLKAEVEELNAANTALRSESAPESEMINDNVISLGHPDVAVNGAGYAVEKQFYPAHELPAHARPAGLDPRVNGPFLDEVRAMEEVNRRDVANRPAYAQEAAKLG